MRADLEATARPVGSSLLTFGPDAVGAGLVDADAALRALALAPTVAILTPPAALSSVTRPSIAFVADRRAAFTCSLDGAPATPCTSPFIPSSPLADGGHFFRVTASDVAGHSGTATAKFAIDTTGPTVTFTKRPKAVVKTKKKSVKPAFGFASSEPNSNFLCQIDGAPFKPCAPSSSWSFKVGKHVVSVKAVDAVGNEGAPVAYRFKVVKVQPKKSSKHHHGKGKHKHGHNH